MLKVNNIKGSILPAIILSLGIFFYPSFAKPAEAVCNFYSSMTETVKNVSNWTTPCTVAAVEGIDNSGDGETSIINTAALSLGTGGSVTINNGGKLIVGSLQLGSGSIAIQSGGEIRTNAPIYVADTDADGWPSAFSFYEASASGRRRLSLMKSFITPDCSDSAYEASNICCTANGGACSADGGCCSSICGTDTDGDNYFSLAAGHAGTCQATSKPYTDCYDANANAKPGSTTCSSTNRGDGSYDYNCAGAAGGNICGTTFYQPILHQQVNWNDARQTCNLAESYVNCAEGTPVCGAYGYMNNGSYWQWYQCAPTYTCYLIGTPGYQACQ